MSPSALPDDPRLADIPIKFADTVLADGFDSDDLDQEVPQLMSFAATFYLRFLDDEFDVTFTGFDDDTDRVAVLGLATNAEVKGEKAEALDLLTTFDDFCDLFDQIGESYSGTVTRIYEGDIVDLTYRLVQEMAGWADETGRSKLEARASEAADRLKKVVAWMRS